MSGMAVRKAGACRGEEHSKPYIFHGGARFPARAATFHNFARYV
jgi:hypothetical protein